jgi:hypothetical protein
MGCAQFSPPAIPAQFDGDHVLERQLDIDIRGHAWLTGKPEGVFVGSIAYPLVSDE